MEKIKSRWDINQNWQFLFPFLGVLLVAVTAYIFSRRFLHLFSLNNTYAEWPFTLISTIVFYFVIIRVCMWCFKKLKNKWIVTYRWEMIAIFIVFAITGSVSAKLAQPITEWIGLERETVNGWVYWPVRILLILPIYQILLIVFGWLFGQFRFFLNFEKKMLKRMGLGFLIP